MGKMAMLMMSVVMLVGIPQMSDTAEACGPFGGQGITGAGSGSSRPVGSQGASHGRPGSCAREDRGRRLPDRSERDPLDKARGGGGKARRSRGRGKSRESGKGGRTTRLSDEDSGTGRRGKGHGEGGHPSEAPGRNSGGDVIVTTERPDDVPLLMGMMIRMGLHEIIDRHVPRHPLQRELSWGMTAVTWLAYVLSEGDHRKVAAEDYIKGMRHTLRRLTGHEMSEADFTDDRLTNLLGYLGDRETWERIEEDLSRRTVSVYELPTEVVRCDATTVSGHHEVTGDGMFQFGHSKDDPTLPQIKMMTAALDPLGMPLATDIVSGERADDPLYVPVIRRISSCLGRRGLLYVGDCKMCAADTRRHIVGDEVGGHYLCPLPRTGDAAKDIERWTDRGITKEGEGSLGEVTVTNEKGEEVLIAKGYVLKRRQREVFGEDEKKGGEDGEKGEDKEEEEEEGEGEGEGEGEEKRERVFVVKSPAHARKMEGGLERRLENAEKKLRALTPPRGRGKKQIKDEAKLMERAEGILKGHRVGGLLGYECEREIERRTKYVGRGRGGANRDREVVERVRYQITAVTRDENRIKKEKERHGWRAYVTDIPKKGLSLGDAVRCYRREHRIEHVFRRLKGRLNASPLHVRRNDQIRGMTCLLTLGVRVLTLTEFVVRRSLRSDNAELGGLHPENRRRRTDKPTAERLLKAFSDITLTIMRTRDGRVTRHLTPLSGVQGEILKRAGLSPSLYKDLEINKSPPQLTE